MMVSNQSHIAILLHDSTCTTSACYSLLIVLSIFIMAWLEGVIIGIVFLPYSFHMRNQTSTPFANMQVHTMSLMTIHVYDV